MDIYVVQQGDNIYSIAERYGVTVEKLILDNGLVNPYTLIIGQAIVIAYAKQSHTVMQGDTLQSIADSYNVTIMQILRNNPYLSDREYIIPGETIVISYNTIRSITTNGFTYPYIKRDTLIKNLPGLTYLSIFNYTTSDSGEIITYFDDTETIKMSKDYGVIPLMMLTTLTLQGDSDIALAYNILLNEEFQEKNINQFISIIKSKGYHGINLIFNFLDENTQSLYLNFAEKISYRLKQEELLFFISINFQTKTIENKLSYEQIDYSRLSLYVNGIIFLKLVWGANYDPPAPVRNIRNMSELIDYVTSVVSSDKIIIGMPTIGYDWQLPYIPNKTRAVSLTFNAVLDLALDVGAIIQFDEDSLTPYFYYNQYEIGLPLQHIVWFIDSRSLAALNKIIIDDSLNGSGIWNIMIYNPQLWIIINSQFDIIKYI